MARKTPPRGYALADTQRRRQWLLDKTGVELNQVAPEEPEQLRGIIENHVGFLRLPMAVAGPLSVQGSYAKGEFYVPLCTVEGTLAMSMTRGLLLTHESGGIKTRHIKQELSRSPIFTFEDIDEAARFERWVEANLESIRAEAESTTRHGHLLRIDRYPFQNSVILEFVYDTAEAAGQNMVTLATHKASMFINQTYPSNRPFKYLIESNFNCDKNPAHKTVLQGRGHQVVASARIREDLLRKMVRCKARDIVESWDSAIRGAQLGGVVGMNMHVANALTAIYLATGQDAACVAENAVGTMDFKLTGENDLYAVLAMPSISVGTVGGGTRLKQQRKNLDLLGCNGKHSSRKLAEIICACALALEISLGAAIVSDEFAKSHAVFGRPV